MYLEDRFINCRRQGIVAPGVGSARPDEVRQTRARLINLGKPAALPGRLAPSPNPSHQGRGDVDEGKSEERWIRSLFATQSMIGEYEI